MLKIKNVVKSNESKQVNNSAIVTGNTGSYVKLGVPSHTQYNNEVSMLNYTKSTKYQKYTMNNYMLYSGTDETLVKSTFETIGEEPIIGHCITTEDLINIYANGCIQEFYEEYCKLHTDKENVILGKLLSIIGIEVYKDVVCYGGIYKGKYMVSNMGNVLSLKKKHFGKTLNQVVNTHGYLYVQLWHKSHIQNIRVNRLVALTFYGEPTEKLDVCHSNDVKTDNRLFNLKFGTRSYNMNNPITQRKRKATFKAKAESTESASTSNESTTASTSE